MELLTQVEVINELNKYSEKTITKQAFYKRATKGQIKIHYKPNSKKKFYKLDEVARVYGIKINEIESSTPVEIKEDVDIFTLTHKEELNSLLKRVDTPIQEVAVIKDFWDGKLKEYKAREADGELMQVDEALYVYQVTGTKLKGRIYEIGHRVKAQFPDVSQDVINFIYSEIDKEFDEFTKDTETI